MSPTTNDMSQIDCGVIIALKEEYADKRFFQGFQTAFGTKETISRRNRAYFPFRFTSKDGDEKSGIVTVLHSMGPMPASDATRAMIEDFDPAIMINIGLAGAIATNLKLGDIVVADSSEDYESLGAVIDDPAEGYTHQLHGATYRSYGPFFHSVLQFDMAKDSQHADWRRFAAESLHEGLTSSAVNSLRSSGLVGEFPNIEGGPLACGNKVIKSPRFLKELRNWKRKLLAIDMESAGFLKACGEIGERPRLVLRVISDFADSRKEQLDQIGEQAIRAWAMASAYDLLARLLRHTLPVIRLPQSPAAQESPFDVSAQRKRRLTALCRKQFLKVRYQQLSIRSRTDVQDYDHLFRYILSHPRIPNDRNVFEYLESIITSSRGPYPVRVEGEPGTGKTTLLNVFYLWLLGRYEEDTGRAFPVYINLRAYERPPLYRTRAEAANRLRSDLSDLRDLIQDNQAVVVILDGIDEYIKVSDPLENYVLDLLNFGNNPCKRVIGVGLNYMPNEERFRRHLPGVSDPDDVWVFSGVSTTHPAISDFIAAMQQVITGDRSEKVRDAVLTCVSQKLRLTSLDAITVSMLIKFVPRRNSNINSLSSLYESFCDDFLNRHERDSTLLDAAALAYRYAIRQDLFEHDEVLPRRHWRLIHRHRLIKDYLVAVHVVHSFRELGKGQEKAVADLGCVYPQEINQFAKELFNSEPGIQNEVLRGAAKAYEKGDLATKTHACYMAGRVSGITNISAKKRAIAFLSRCRRDFEAKEIQVGAEIDRHELLLGRTAYISLAYLCEGDASDTYLQQLMSNERADDLNRGFHLEYYGDIPFDARDPQSMAHEDPMGDPSGVLPCDRTFERLCGRIASRINDDGYGLRDIEIYTLCSLAQHRHAIGVLSDENRQKLNSLLPLLRDAEVARPLRPYLSMIQEHFTEPRFFRASIHEKLYRLKSELRNGWIGELKSEERVESVADHTLLAVYLARIYLPESDPREPKYDKRRIMDMILYHDIGEFVTGDVSAARKTPMDDQAEEAAVQYLGACGTYLNVSNLSEIVNLHHDFEQSDDINKNVAKDIDRLEYYIQLNRYRGSLSAQFVLVKERKVESDLRTSHGRRIFEIMREPYRERRGQLADPSLRAGHGFK